MPTRRMWNMRVYFARYVCAPVVVVVAPAAVVYISHRDIYFYLIYFCAVALQISTQSFSHFLCASSCFSFSCCCCLCRLSLLRSFRLFVYIHIYFAASHPPCCPSLLFLSLFLPFLRFDTRFQLICRFDDKISVFSSGYVNVRGMQKVAGEQEGGSVSGQGLKRCTNIGYSDWRG